MRRAQRQFNQNLQINNCSQWRFPEGICIAKGKKTFANIKSKSGGNCKLFGISVSDTNS